MEDNGILAPVGDFPAFAGEGARTIYLDNAATTQKPRCVIETIEAFYGQCAGNVHRAVHGPGRFTTNAYENARETVARRTGAPDPAGVVFTSGTTASVNLAARSFGEKFVSAGDEILVTCAEHHSNFLPWQQLCLRTGASLRVLGIGERGTLEPETLERAIGPRTRLLALCHVSNVLGAVNPVARLTEIAHARGVPVLVDGAQAAAHLPVNVRELGCDFYCFSGHKVYGPSGIGVLWLSPRFAEELPPAFFGGEMVSEVTEESCRFLPSPRRFEAGTPDFAGAIGLASALDYLAGLGAERVRRHERELCRLAFGRLGALEGIRIYSDPENCAGILSFTLDGVSVYDAALLLDARGVAVRAGVHCAAPLHARLGAEATLRVSFAVYNTVRDVEILAEALDGALRILRGHPGGAL